jgi:hypothetical protein
MGVVVGVRLAEAAPGDVGIAASRSSSRVDERRGVAPATGGAMKYVLLIYTSEKERAAAPHDQQQAIYQEYEKVAREFEERGVMRGGDELADTPAATTVRVRDAQKLVTDGPFAETKEQLGGYFLVEVDDLDTAIELAAKIPGARHGSIEVRPIIEG